MHNTIPYPAPPLDDVRVVAARQAQTELPDASDNEEPSFWISRLKPQAAYASDPLYLKRGSSGQAAPLW